MNPPEPPIAPKPIPRPKPRRKYFPPRNVRAVWRDTRTVAWSEFAGPRALRCLPAILAPLLYGIVSDQPVPALLAAAAATSVGFGSFQQLYRSCLAPMLLASLSMAASAFVGTQIGSGSAALVAAMAVWGFACGLSSAIGPGATYIGTQSIVFLLVATSFPTPPRAALPLVALVLGAGLLQALIISLFRLSRRAPVPETAPTRTHRGTGPLRGARLALHTLRRSAVRRQAGFRHGVRLGLTMAIVTALSRLSPDPHSYWMPMTAALLLQQDRRQTITRALSRVGGTVLGAGVATLIAATVRPGHETLALLVGAFAWLSYSTLGVNYFLFAASLTAYIVFLLSFAGLPELPLVLTRVAFTTLGAACALLANAVRRSHPGGVRLSQDTRE